jgi:chaperonin cofactor prefoldin
MKTMTDNQIAKLFEQERRLERQLEHVRSRIRAARPTYAARHGLLAFPSVDTMRKAVAS